jgi:hypothetical protein
VKRLVTVSVALSAAAAAVYRRARHLAEIEQRPLGDVLAGFPGRLVSDLRTLPEDVRTAAHEGREAAGRKSAEIEEDFRHASDPASAGESPGGAPEGV